MKLSYSQRWALIHVYAPDYDVQMRLAPDEEGFAVQTLRSLQRKGLIDVDENAAFERATITAAGREALDLGTIRPGNLELAIKLSYGLITSADVEEYYAHEDVPAVCVEEDELRDHTVWTDTTGVLAAIRIGGTAGWYPFEEEPGVVVSAVARLVSELGYPVEAERYGLSGDVVYFSRPEE